MYACFWYRPCSTGLPSGCACLGRMLAHGCGESTKPCGPGDEMEQPTHCPDRRRAGSPCPMRRALVSSHSVHTDEEGVPDRIRTPHTVALWGWAITRAKYLRGTASPPTSMSYCIPSALLVSASRVEMTGPRALGAAQCGLIFTSHIRGPLNPRRPFVQGRRSSFKYKQGYGLLQDTNRHVSIIVDFFFNFTVI